MIPDTSTISDIPKHTIEGTLMVAASVGGDPKNRLHQLVIGESDELKSKLANIVMNIVSGVTYVDVQSSTKLFAWVDRKENMLRLGPILMAQNSICVLNGIDKMPYFQQYRLKEIIDDGMFTANEPPWNGHKIRANIVFIAMAARRSKVMISDRFDFTFPLKEMNEGYGAI